MKTYTESACGPDCKCECHYLAMLPGGGVHQRCERCEMAPKLYTEAEAGAMVAEIAGLKAALCDRDEERTAWKAYAEALYVFGRKHQQANAARARLVALGEIEK